MKKAAFFTTAALFAISLPVFAQEFPDVPSDHWAYGAISQLVGAGVIQGYPDGTFGGKRAMTRYEFAEALAKAIPAIKNMIGTGAGVPGPVGPAGAQGPAGPAGPAGISPEQLANLQRMANEFRDELAALGVDVDALKRDVAALNERVTTLENEVRRIQFYGEGNMIGRGEVNNVVDGGPVADIDNRLLSVGATEPKNPLANSAVLENYQFGLKAKVSDSAVANAKFDTGNYMVDFAGITNNNFTLWNLTLDAAVNLGPLGASQVVVGRQPFQLTPLTMKFVDPDSYTNVSVLDNGDYILDAARASFNIGRIGLTAFGGKTASTTEFAPLARPALLIGGGAEIAQLAGARLQVGTPFNGNLGLTYMQAGLAATTGRAQIFGADLNANIAKIALNAEYGKSDPNDTLTAAAAGVANGFGLDSKNNAWNANLGYQFGNLGIKGGYTEIQPNYFAPGWWSKLGRAVNLVNVKGPVVNLNYALSRSFALVADASFLEPVEDNAAVQGRTSTDRGVAVSAVGVDKIDAWKAGLRYNLTSANSVDLGWEEVQWKAIGGGTNTRERYISMGLGHSFNPNSSLKLLYQIVDYRAGVIAPYTVASPGRGGVATAQFQLKY